MWDWSGAKTPPPSVRTRGEAAEEAQNQGVTPVRRDIQPMPARPYRTLPPTAPASAYPDSAKIPPSPSYPQRMPPMTYPRSAPAQPYMPQPQVPLSYGQQPYAMPPQPYPPQPYSQPQPYAPRQPYGTSPFAPVQPSYPPQQQPYAPQPYGQQPYAQPQPYAPQPYAQPYAPQQPAQNPYQSYDQQPPASGNAQEEKALWEWQFQQTGLLNMDLIEVEFVPLDPNWLSELQKAFKRTRRDFLKYVGYHHTNELLAAGMTDEAIKLVKKGKAPENFNIHRRIPFEYGGTNSFSNLVLIQTHPFHTEIHRFIDMQTLTQPNFKPRKLYLPSPKGKVYFSGEVEISSGGTSRHDRSVYAGFLESTFEYIEQRSMLGR